MGSQRAASRSPSPRPTSGPKWGLAELFRSGSSPRGLAELQRSGSILIEDLLGNEIDSPHGRTGWFKGLNWSCQLLRGVLLLELLGETRQTLTWLRAKIALLMPGGLRGSPGWFCVFGEIGWTGWTDRPDVVSRLSPP